MLEISHRIITIPVKDNNSNNKEANNTEIWESNYGLKSFNYVKQRCKVSSIRLFLTGKLMHELSRNAYTKVELLKRGDIICFS